VKALELAKRNLKEAVRDPLSLGIAIVLPVLLFVIFQALGDLDEVFKPTNLAPGVALFGYVMITFSSAMTLAQDRETAFFDRLLTTPLRSNDFVAAYSLPYVPVAIIQTAVIFGIGAFLGLEINGNAGLVVLILLIMIFWYIGTGMILGSLLSYRAVPGPWGAIMILTIFGGAWFDLAAFPTAFQTVANAFPFVHAIDASRAVMADGSSFSDIATDLLWIAAYTVAVVGLAVILFRRRMHQ
jgi:ABC-2 type transport system permease protein